MGLVDDLSSAELFSIFKDNDKGFIDDNLPICKMCRRIGKTKSGNDTILVTLDYTDKPTLPIVELIKSL